MRTLVLLLGIVGGAFIASPANSEGLPAWAQSQRHYARVLNPIAAQVMSWVDARQVEEMQTIWLDSADLLQITPSHYRFELGVKQGGQQQQSITQIDFDFHAIEGLISQLEATGITSAEPLSKDQLPSTSIDVKRYYRARELAYWWLAHLDGISNVHKQSPVSAWIDSATFTSGRSSNPADVTSARQANRLANGGHLLRSLKIEPTGQTNYFELRLLIDWKGVLSNGKPGIASLQHTMLLRTNEDGSFVVEQIHETMLLPNAEPWTKILC